MVFNNKIDELHSIFLNKGLSATLKYLQKLIHNKSKKRKNLILIDAQYRALKRNKFQGVINYETSSIEINKISKNTLDFIEDIRWEDTVDYQFFVVEELKKANEYYCTPGIYNEPYEEIFSIYTRHKDSIFFDSTSLVRLGTLYESFPLEDELEYDLKKAYNIYIEGAKLGHPEAMLRLGLMNLNGEGVNQNTSKALFWFNKAIEKGYADAMFELAFIYLRGKGGIESSKEKYNEYIVMALQASVRTKNEEYFWSRD